MESQIKIIIKYSLYKCFEVTISNLANVLELKQKCAITRNIPVEK